MGDFQGHPFRGNQYTTSQAEEITFAESPGTGENTVYDVQKRLDDQKHALSADAQITLRHYHTDYTTINSGLREGTIGEGTTKGVVKAMDAAFKEAPKIEDTATVYRGVRSDFFGDLKPGDVIHDSGFVSTSADPATARQYASQLAGRLLGTPNKQATIVRITLPRGTRYLPGAAGHAELILNRGSRFKFKGMGRDSQGTLAVDLELVRDK